jgi:hypothetical protein
LSRLEIKRVKKILAFAIGLGVILGTISFAADDTTDTTKKMDSKKKTKKTKSTDSTTK